MQHAYLQDTSKTETRRQLLYAATLADGKITEHMSYYICDSYNLLWVAVERLWPGWSLEGA